MTASPYFLVCTSSAMISLRKLEVRVSGVSVFELVVADMCLLFHGIGGRVALARGRGCGNMRCIDHHVSEYGCWLNLSSSAAKKPQGTTRAAHCLEKWRALDS